MTDNIAPIRILIADDSPVFQRVLSTCLDGEAGIEVVGVVDNGTDAVERCRALKPDLVTMDIFMPGITGLEATRQIMKECPTRIVIISSMINNKNLKYTFEAMQAGAVEVIDKPQNMLSGNYDRVREQLISVIRKTMHARPARRFAWNAEEPNSAQTPEARGGADERTNAETTTPGLTREQDTLLTPRLDRDWKRRTIDTDFLPSVIAIGGSTGAPAVVADILTHLPDAFQVPILIAQHIVRGFAAGMSEWLNAGVNMEVKLAEDGALLRPGQVRFAPDDMHLGIRSSRRILLTKRSAEDLHVPSVDHLFESTAASFKTQALGIILSGMGRDGAKGLLEMRKAGAVTIGQNEETSVVFGMPRVAMERGAVMKQMSPAGIIRFLSDLDRRVKTLRPSSNPARLL